MTLTVKEGLRSHWLYPVEITTDNQTLEVTETIGGADTTFSVDIPAGTYFCFHRLGPNGSSVAQAQATATWQTGFDGLYREICNQLNGATGGDIIGGGYQIEWVKPAVSPYPCPSAVRIFHADSAVEQFKIHVQSGGSASPLPLSLLGFNDEKLRRDGTSTVESSDDGSGLPEIVGDYTASGIWTSPHHASFKRSVTRREIETTIIDFDKIVTTEWRELIWRPIEYQRVPGGCARRYRGQKPAYGEAAELDWWDTSNAFEDCWEAIKDSQYFLIFHGVPWSGDADPSGRDQHWPTHNCDIELASTAYDDTTTGERRFSKLDGGDVFHNVVEIARLVGEEQKAQIDDVLPDEDQSSEHYRVDAPLIVDPDQRLPY